MQVSEIRVHVSEVWPPPLHERDVESPPMHRILSMPMYGSF